MIPVLYTSEETAFESNGLGRLSDCVSCEVTEERNGIFECEFKYPITGRHYADIAIGNIIYCTHDETKTPQPFDIYKKTAPIDGIVTFNAHHISYRQSNIILQPFEAETCIQAFQRLNPNSINPNPFTYTTNKVVSADFKLTAPASVKSILAGSSGSILDVFGTGEYKYDKFNVYLYLHRGEDTNITIRYGKNLVDLKEEIDTDGTYNAVVPYWQNIDTGELVTLPEGYIIASQGQAVISTWSIEDGQYLTDQNGNVLQFTTVPTKIVAMDMTSYFDNPPSESELRTAAQNRLNNSDAWIPNQNLSIDFVQWTDETAELLQTVCLCDTVSVIYTELGVDVKTKVIKTVYDVLAERYSKIELGDPLQSFADVIMSETVDQLPRSPMFQKVMESAIEKASNMLVHGNTDSYVIIHTGSTGAPDEIYILDDPDPENAVNVIRMNRNGIGFSHDGLNGSYFSAWTIDGSFVADFITAGTMSADRIRTGKLLAVDGESYWDLDDGEFYTATNNASVKINNGAIMCYSPESTDYTGKIGTFYYRGDSTKYGIGLLTKSPMLFLGSEKPDGTYKASIFLNNGADPDGHTESIWITGDVRFSNIVKSETLYVGYISPLDSATEVTFTGNVTLFSNTATLLVGNGLGAGTINVGTVQYYTLSPMSDRRTKNVFEWDDRQDKIIDLLEPVLYQFKNLDGTHTGFIAQDVQKILDDLGIKDSGLVTDDGEYMRLSYQDIIALLVKRTQRQQKKIDELEKRLSKLEARINADS